MDIGRLNLLIHSSHFCYSIWWNHWEKTVNHKINLKNTLQSSRYIEIELIFCNKTKYIREWNRIKQQFAMGFSLLKVCDYLVFKI
jgi:hypothetical protein